MIVNTYEIFLKRNGCLQLAATHYRKDKKSGEIRFYDDRELVGWFLISEVVGVYVIERNQTDSGEQIRARVKAMLRKSKQ
jgi:hypothetical protein